MKKMKKSSPNKHPILDRVVSVEHLPFIVTALFYGRSGTGKTTLSATFPGPRIILDIREKGTDSISDVPDTKVLKVLSWSDLEDIYWALQAGDSGYQTVVVDALHAMQSMAIHQAKCDRLNREAGMMDQTTKHDFMRASGMMQTWIQNFLELEELGINVVLISHDKRREADMDGDDDAIMPEVGPNLMPSVVSTVTGGVKVVGHTFIREQVTRSKNLKEKPKRTIQYCLRVGPHGYYNTKVRSPKSSPIPDFLIDPDYEQIVEVMKGHLAVKSASPAPRQLKKLTSSKK